MKDLKIKNLRFLHFGNGITVCTTEKEEHGDFMKLAHISADRDITWHKKIPENIEREIKNFAKTADPSCSATQEETVFKNIPVTLQTDKYYRIMKNKDLHILINNFNNKEALRELTKRNFINKKF